ncbi:Cysteine--tRNA ligase (plasmid) [Mesomycoplasma conjunctivae]|nr:Cysteine--tRNA ligase [Mesomycoplasma conjunctivae]
MSKSLGNVILAKDFLKEHDREILKLIILSSKISAPINVTNELIENMYVILNKYKKLILNSLLILKILTNQKLIKMKNLLR